MPAPIHVVYVEDEPSIAQLLASGLGLFGITVKPIYMTAEQFLANLDTPETNQANMFVFDIRLPKMTGLNLAKEIRKRGEIRPILLVSAWPPPTQEELGAIQAKFLPKPFDFADIVRTIQALV